MAAQDVCTVPNISMRRKQQLKDFNITPVQNSDMTRMCVKWVCDCSMIILLEISSKNTM